jgi:hypothetical protein
MLTARGRALFERIESSPSAVIRLEDVPERLLCPLGVTAHESRVTKV